MSEKKVYSEYKDSGAEWLGKVPAHWQVCGLKFVGKTVAGSGFPHEYQGVEGEKYPFLKVNALGRADALGVINSREDSISESVAEKLRASIIPAGSVVLAKIGAALLLGRIRTLSEDSCIDNNMLSVQISNKAVSRFVFYAMQQIQFDVLVNPGAVPSLSERNFRSFKLAFPPLNEQRAIAAYLDRETKEIDDFIADQDELIALLNERRAATITQAVSHGLDSNAPMKESGNELVPSFPAHWVQEKLSRLGLVMESGTSVNGYSDPEDLLGVRVLKTGCASKGYFDPSENKKVVEEDLERVSCPVRSGSLILNRANTPELVGSCAQAGEDYPNLYLSDKLWQLGFSQAENRFMYWWMKTPTYRAQIRLHAVGASASMQNLSFADFRSFAIALPPSSEQVEIADYIDRETAEIDGAIADAKKAIELSKERRAALISAAVTGKIDVRNHITAELGAA